MILLALQRHVLKILCGVLITFLLVFLFFIESPKAHAQFGGGVVTVIGGAGSAAEIETALSSSLNHILNQALNEKEFVLDPLVFELSQKILQEQVSSFLNWINGGFTNPDGTKDTAYIASLEKYRQDARDQAVGDAIYGGAVRDSGMCQEFSHEVQRQILKEYQAAEHTDTGEQFSCTTAQVSGNLEGYLSGEEGGFINNGGWSAVLSIMMNPQDTPLGAKFEAKAIIEERANEAEKDAIIEALNNRGYKSLKVCDETSSSGAGIADKCRVVTPGAQIADMASFNLQVPILSQLQADEFSEVLSSLFGGLVNQAFSGINGMLGLGGNTQFSVNAYGSSGGASYLDALLEISLDGQHVGIDAMKDTYETTEAYLNYQITILTLIGDISNEYIETGKDHEGESCWDLEFPDDLTDVLDELEEKIPQTITTVLALELLIDGYENATSQSEQAEYLNDYSTLLTEGYVATESDLLTIEHELKNTIRPAVVDFEEEIQQEDRACN